MGFHEGKSRDRMDGGQYGERGNRGFCSTGTGLMIMLPFGIVCFFQLNIIKGKGNHTWCLCDTVVIKLVPNFYIAF